MLKLRAVIILLVTGIILCCTSTIGFASYTQLNTGNLGAIFTLRAYPNHEVRYTVSPLTRQDSIIFCTVRVKKTYYASENPVVRFWGMHANYYGAGIYESQDQVTVTSTSWTGPYTITIPNIGCNIIRAVNMGNASIDVEIQNVTYLRYNLDNVSLTLVNGFPRITVVNNTPIPMTYYFYNVAENRVVTQYFDWNMPSQWQFHDTSALPGKNYSYRLYWGFKRQEYDSNCNNYLLTEVGSVFVPVDYQLTQKVDEVKGGTINTYGNTVDAVRDSSGTALAEARQAKTNASNAYNSVNNVNGNTITAVRDAGGTVLDSSRLANTKLDTLQAAVTNIQNSMSAGDTTPPSVRIRTVSGAMATSGTFIQAVLDVSDNASTIFTYSLDGITYQAVPASKLITLSVSHSGPNVILVWVKDQAGNIGTTSITIRKF